VAGGQYFAIGSIAVVSLSTSEVNGVGEEAIAQQTLLHSGAGAIVQFYVAAPTLQKFLTRRRAGQFDDAARGLQSMLDNALCQALVEFSVFVEYVVCCFGEVAFGSAKPVFYAGTE
jgi:hypothetical protein